MRINCEVSDTVFEQLPWQHGKQTLLANAYTQN